MPYETMTLGLVIGATLGAGFKSAFRSAQDTIEGLGKTASKLSLGKQLSGEIVKLETKLGDLKRKQAAAGGGANALAQDIGEVEGALSAATKKAHAHGLEIGDAKEAHKRFGTQLDKTRGKMGRMQRAQAARAKRQDLQEQALPLLGAAYGSSRITGKAMDLEEQRIHLRSVITPVAGGKDEALERSVAHARAAARTSLASESELLELQYQLSSGGLDEEAARLGSVIAANVGKVMRSSGAQAAEVMKQVENTFGGGMERIGDVLAKTQMRFGSLDFGQLGEGMAEAASGAIAAKLPLAQTAAAIGMLNTAGQTGGEAGASLNAVLRQLGKAAGELGFSLTRSADGSLDLGATLQALHERLPDPADIDARKEAIQGLFGDQGAAGLEPLLENLDSWRGHLDAVDQSAGTVAESIARFEESSGGQWTMLTQNIEAIGTTIAGTLLPILNLALGPLAEFAGWLDGFIERFPLLGQVIGGAAAAIGVFVGGALLAQGAMSVWAIAMGGPVGDALEAVGGGLKTMGGRLKKAGSGALGLAKNLTASNIAAVASAAKIKIVTAAQWLWNAALNANPIGLVVAAVAALAAGVFVVYKNWEPIKEFFGKIWEGIKASAGAAWEGIKTFTAAAWESGILPVILGPIGIVIRYWDKIKTAAVAVWEGIKTFTAAAWESGILPVILGPIGIVIRYWDKIKTAAVAVWEGIKTFTAAAWESGILPVILGPIGIVVGYWDKIKAAAVAVWEGIKTFTAAAWESGILPVILGPIGIVVGYWDKIKAAAVAVWEGIVDFFSGDNIGAKMIAAGKSLIGALANGLKTGAAIVYEALKSVLGPLGKLLPYSDAKEGPLSRLTASGQSILGTMGAGVRRAGAAGLQRPLAGALGTAAAGLALTLSVPPPARAVLAAPAAVGFEPAAARPSAAAGAPTYNITIHQQPGEDAQALVERVIEAIEERRGVDARGRLYDG